MNHAAVEHVRSDKSIYDEWIDIPIHGEIYDMLEGQTAAMIALWCGGHIMMADEPPTGAEFDNVIAACVRHVKHETFWADESDDDGPDPDYLLAVRRGV